MGKVRPTQLVRLVAAAPTAPLVAATQSIRLVAATAWDPAAAVNGTALVYPGWDTSLDTGISVTRRNRLSCEFYVQPGSTFTIHVTTKPSDGNIGVCRLDGTDDHSQATPADATNYSFTLLGGRYFVYSWKSGNTYRGALTGSGTYDLVGAQVVGVGASQLVRLVAAARTDPAVRVTQIIRLVAAADTTPDPTCPPSTGGQHGYATFG